MNRHDCIRLVVLVLSCAALCGCGEDENISAWNPLKPMAANLPSDPDDNEYVLKRMEFARAAIDRGCYTRAERRLTEAFEQLEAEKSNTAAALTSERHKYYKGETYERAAINWYLGYINYRKGDYNTARIYFSRALIEDRKAVVKEDTPPVFGDDFGVAYYWLGRTYRKLGETDNARIAFEKAARLTPREEKEIDREREERARFAEKRAEERLAGEEWAFREFHNPKNEKKFVAGAVNLAAVTGSLDDPPQPLPFAPAESPVLAAAESRGAFFDDGFQANTNVVLTLELGDPPKKELGGIQNERTDIVRAPILPHAVRVYVDGVPAGEAYKVLELWDQAATQDRVGAKEGAQVTKAIAKTALSLFVNTSGWDVSGDIRRWRSLPGRVYVFAAKLRPGVHAVRFEMYDVAGRLLPRWTNTYYGIFAPGAGEHTVLLRARFDGDNAIPPAAAAVAADAGARPEGWEKEEDDD